MERGRPGFTQDFTSLALLRIRLGFGNYAYGAITRSGQPFQAVLLAPLDPKCRPTTPESKLSGLGFGAFARRY